uniref:EGF-like domain-containing protein n=1 Tax=Sexangularia sp. CB-2014 TaxID=1486929 RepID=A0A7S1VBH3_9EUKA
MFIFLLFFLPLSIQSLLHCSSYCHPDICTKKTNTALPTSCGSCGEVGHFLALLFPCIVMPENDGKPYGGAATIVRGGGGRTNWGLDLLRLAPRHTVAGALQERRVLLHYQQPFQSPSPIVGVTVSLTLTVPPYTLLCGDGCQLQVHQVPITAASSSFDPAYVTWSSFPHSTPNATLLAQLPLTNETVARASQTGVPISVQVPLAVSKAEGARLQVGRQPRIALEVMLVDEVLRGQSNPQGDPNDARMSMSLSPLAPLSPLADVCGDLRWPHLTVCAAEPSTIDEHGDGEGVDLPHNATAVPGFGDVDCSPACANGGVCRDGRCLCPPDAFGPTCEDLVDTPPADDDGSSFPLPYLVLIIALLLLSLSSCLAFFVVFVRRRREAARQRRIYDVSNVSIDFSDADVDFSQRTPGTGAPDAGGVPLGWVEPVDESSEDESSEDEEIEVPASPRTLRAGAHLDKTAAAKEMVKGREGTRVPKPPPAERLVDESSSDDELIVEFSTSSTMLQR